MLNFGNLSFGRDDNGVRISAMGTNLYLNAEEVQELIDWLYSSKKTFRYYPNNHGLVQAQAEVPYPVAQAQNIGLEQQQQAAHNYPHNY